MASSSTKTPWLQHRGHHPQATGTTGGFGLRLTAAGVLYILLTLFLGFAAVNTGNNLLYLVVSALLGFMSLSGWLGRKNLQGLSCRWDVPPQLYAETPTVVRLQLHNGKHRWPSFLLDLLAPDACGLVTALPAGETVERFPRLELPHRGEHSLPPVEVRSAFPVNFFVRRIQHITEQRCLVLPKPRPVPQLWSNNTAGLTSGQTQRQRNVSEGDFYSLRAYNGEPMRQIHWRQSARQQSLQVKQLAASGPQPLQIELGDLPGNTLEIRLGQACWLIRQCARSNRPVGLTLGHKRWPPVNGAAHRLTLLQELARYEA